MRKENKLETRVTRLEEHMSTLNEEMGEIKQTAKEIKTALVGDLGNPETMEKSIDKRLSKIEQRNNLIIATVVFIVPIVTWLIDKFVI